MLRYFRVVSTAGNVQSSGAVRARVLLIGLSVLAFPTVARAEGLFRPRELVREAVDANGLRNLVSAPSEWVLTPGSGAPNPRSAGTRAAFRNLLGTLVVTRDLKLPGAPFLGLRMIPTRRELGGDSRIPIVFKPRVMAKSGYGVDVTANF